MKIFFISDIHGSSKFLKRFLDIYKKEAGDYLVILGDILYHGARNPIPEGHNPKEVISLLNQLANEIIGVRGNCDSEVDQMVLDFPITADYNSLILGGRHIFLTHGHIYGEEIRPKLRDGSALVYGHSHILKAEKSGGIYLLNPGSITLPKEGNPRTYGVLERDEFRIYDLDAREVKKIKME